MKAVEYKLPTTGKLLEELTKIDDRYLNYNVVCWDPDGLSYCIVGYELDADGDFRIELDTEAEDGGYEDVDMFLSALESYDKNIKVYFAACGLYLVLDFNRDGSTFSENVEDEVIGCYVKALGEYEMAPVVSSFLTDSEKLELEEKLKRKKVRNNFMSVVQWGLILSISTLLCYNMYSLIRHWREFIFESIVWIIVCIICLSINILTLHSSD